MIRNKYFKKIILIISALTIISFVFSACGNKKTLPDSTQNNSGANTDNNSSNNNSSTPSVEISKGPEFSISKYSKEPEFATEWLKNSDGSISACIEGKGSEAKEEGIGKIVIKNSQNEENILEIKDKSNQESPLYINWWDNENLLVIIGNGYGTVAMGGDLYMLNVETGKSAVIVETKDSKKQVISAQKNSNDLDYKAAVFEDDNLIKYHIEDDSISGYADKADSITNQLK